MATLVSIALAIAAVMSGPVTAQTAPPPKPTAADPNQIICRTQDVLGSRLQKRRVCMTRAQWADAQSQDQQAVERVQSMRGVKE